MNWTPKPGAFDWDKAKTLVPFRTSVFGYVDDAGDLHLLGSDAVEQCDTDLRINAEDIKQFIEELLALTGYSVAAPPAEPKVDRTNAERQRRHRQKRNGRNGETVTNGVTEPDAVPLFREASQA